MIVSISVGFISEWLKKFRKGKKKSFTNFLFRQNTSFQFLEFLYFHHPRVINSAYGHVLCSLWQVAKLLGKLPSFIFHFELSRFYLT